MTVLRACLLLVFCALALPLRAQETVQARFEGVLLGLPVGRLDLAYALGAERYAATILFRAAGLGRLVRNGQFEAIAQGTVRVGGLRPETYEGARDFGRRPARIAMAYAGGVPRILRRAPEPPQTPWSIDPATQGGTVDPGTFGLELLRPLPEAQACGRVIEIYDGARRARVTLEAARMTGARRICAGRYDRVAGYAPEDLEERKSYAFELEFAPLADGLVALQVARFDSFLGAAELRRLP